MIKRTAFLLMLSVLLLSAQFASAQATAKQQAGQSLLHSAQSLLYQPEATGRAGRIFSLIRAAGAIDSAQHDTCRILADVLAVRSQPQQAADALAKCLQGNHVDYQLAQRWLSLRIVALQTAEKRVELLRGLLDDSTLPDSIRAIAAVQQGNIRLGQGERAAAEALFGRALKIDADSPAALSAMLSSSVGIGPEDRPAMQIRLHQALPGSEAHAVNAASALSEVGLYERATDLLEFVGQLRKKQGVQASQQAYISARCNALLDAGMYSQVAELLEPYVKESNEYTDLYLPLIEAYQRAGKGNDADPLIKVVGDYLQKRVDSRPVTAELALRLAWFHTVSQPDLKKALGYARTAQTLQPGSKLAQRILAINMLSGDQAAKGVELLEPLTDTDPWAAVYLARHYQSTGQADLARKTLEAIKQLNRSGPAARELLPLAKQLGAKLPQPDGAKKAAEAFDVGRPIRRWTLNCQQALAVSLSSVGDEVLLGQPIEVVATIRNTTQTPLPIGPEGLARATVSLQVITGGGKVFSSLPTVDLPVGRMLKPGQSISQRVRIDVGSLETTLMQSPLSRGSLTISGTFNPRLNPDGKIVSASQQVPLAPAVVVRKAFVGVPESDNRAGWRKAYQSALADLQDLSKSKNLADRRLAARQVASLLALARRVELASATLPQILGNVAIKTDAMAIYKKLMLDRNPVVRAEMVAGLQFVPLSRELLTPLAPRIEDPSWLVRQRVAETLGASQAGGAKPVLDVLAADKVKHVSSMAKALSNAK